MNNPHLPNRIKNYLDGTMNAKEARQFEADLESDFELKKAFVAYAIIPKPPLTPNAQKSRALVDSIYNTLPPFPTPSLPFLFRLKMWLQPLRNKLVAASFLLLIVVWISIPKTTLDLEKTIAANAIPATCKGVAGENLSPRQIFERASDIYCGHETESAAQEKLQQLSAGQESFCMADYYLAHWYLKNGRYAEAVPLFEACLSAQEIIEANQETAESRNSILLNALLAKFGKDRNIEATLIDLNSLSTKAKPGSEVARNIDNLKKILAKQ